MENRVLTNYKKLPLEVKKALKNEYPLGYDEILTTIKIGSNGESASALAYRFNDVLYLIKYTLKKRKDIHDDSEEKEDRDSQRDNELNISTGGEWYEDYD